MAVVVIIGIVAALAARIYSGQKRGEVAPLFGRTLMNLVHMSRDESINIRRPVRLHFNPTSVLSEMQDSDTPGTWRPYEGFIQVPDGVEVCEIRNSTVLVAAGTVTCPLAATTSITMGMVRGTYSASTCATSTLDPGTIGTCTACAGTNLLCSGSTGATIFFHTTDGRKQYKMVIYGLTGMVRFMDQW
jgi:hypothetical protein